jgi:hypothetical protein
MGMIMQTLTFGWEANGIENSACQSVIPVPNAITILGYQFNMNQGRMGLPGVLGIGQAEYSVVLCQVWITDSPTAGMPNIPGMEMTFNQVGGTNKYASGSSGAQSGALCVLSSQADDNECDNQYLVMPPLLSIPVPAGSFIVVGASQSGFPTNLSFSGVIYYQ